MQVRLLGPVTCRHEGRSLPLGGVKQRAVFALLALEAGRVVSTDRLIDELWPDGPPAQAVLTLRAYVSRLRRVLEPTPAQITTQPPGWVLSLPAEATDLSRFSALLDRGRAAAQSGEPTALRSAVADLDQALGLWSGEALGDLADVPFARTEATRLSDLRDAAVETLLEARLAVGEPEVVVDQARRVVAARPFRERGWRALMIALYRTGRQAEALDTYGQLRRTLADELGLDPSPALRDLERQLLQHDPVLRAPRPSADRSLVQVEPSLPAADPDRPDPARTTAGWPLVGRRPALAALASVVRAASSGSGGLVVVRGPMGAGKTTVFDALEEVVRRSGGRVVHGHGLPDGAAPALWPWVTVLRELTAATPGLAEGTRGDDDPSAAALAALQPVPPEDPSETRPPLSRSLLFRGVLDLLERAQRSGPVAVLVDDAHWVDRDTLTLLRLAVEELAPDGLLVAVAVRSDEPTAELDRALGSLPRDLVTRVELAPLAAEDVSALIRTIDGREPEPGVVAAVTERTGGNALFVTELVKLLSAERGLTTSAAQQALPAEVLDVLGRRLDRLPAATVSLLGVAALLGSGPVTPDLLARTTGLDEEQVLDSCEAALLAGLLVETGDGTGRFALSHALVRETLVARLSVARRVHLHAKIAAALQQRNPQQTDEVLEVARQLVLAAPAVGPAAAVPYLVSAAEDALRRSATEAAHDTLVQALRLAAAVPDPVVRQSLHALVQGHLDALWMWAASSAEERLPTPAPAAPTDAASAAAWLGTVVATAVRGRYAGSMAAAAEVLADRPAPIAASTARFVLGHLALLSGDLRTARRELDVLRQLLADGVDIQLPGRLFHMVEDVYAYRAMLEHAVGNEAAADEEVAGLLRSSTTAEDVQVKCDFYLALLATMRGDADQARRRGEQCRRLSDRLGFGIFELHADQVQAWADAMKGDPTGPERADAAAAAYRNSGIKIFAPTYRMLAAEAYARHGDLATARERARQSAEVAAETGEYFLGPRLRALATSLIGVVGAGISP
ncbi:BTAD domain-containing putative transcriptional regulator [uncultured Friedmanniella sp.]|uniref:BTAD domain-containing putative transcriptional regulator n=1 Tax=uncultured Friedmanniella sp. TaxID=335381 RepID=UPI0035CC421A